MIRRQLLVYGTLLAAIACGGDTTGPPDSPPELRAERLAVGDTSVATFASSDSLALYTLRVSEPAELALFLQAEQGNFSLTISDSVTGEWLASTLVFEDQVPGHLTLTRSDIVRAAAGQVLLVRIYPAARTSGRLRLWVYRVNRAPEMLPGTITIGDTLQGEILENTADIDEFVFPATEGEELIAYVQGEQGTFPTGVSLQVLSPSGQLVTRAHNAAGDVELEAQPTAMFLIPTSGNYRVAVGHLVTGVTTEFPGTGGFKVLIRRIDRRPEHSSEIQSPGDTLEIEKIDFVGDIDEFQVPVIRDSSYNVFLQTLPAPKPVLLHVLITTDAGDRRSVSSLAGDSALAGQFSGTFTATQTGSLRLQVSGNTLGPAGGLHRGGYRLFVYPIDRAPELSSRTIAPGDSITETIEYPGDIDHFTVSSSSTGMLNLFLHRNTVRTDWWLDLYWRLNGQPEVLHCYQASCGSGIIQTTSALPLQVASQLGFVTPLRGSYRLVALAIDPGPEGRAKQIAIGDVVTGEVSPVGDGDTYEFSYSAGDLLQLEATGGSGNSGDAFGLSFHNPAGQFMGGYVDWLPISTGRFTLPSSGIYSITIAGEPQALTSVGSYSFTLSRFGSAAEMVTSPLAIGDSVSETIGQSGDVDDFVVAGAPGAEIQVFLRGTYELKIDAVVAESSTLVRSGTYLTTGRLTLPETGRIGLRVHEPRMYSGSLRESGLGFVGPYSVAVHAINRAPETVGSTVSLGTMKDGEAIELEGDIDEFSLSGTAGQTVSATIQAPFAFNGYVELALIDPSNGSVLGTARTRDATVVSTGNIILPATRTYLVRVGPVDDTEGKGQYRFLVQ